MKTLLILAAVLMMQGCVTFHNEKVNGSFDADLTAKNNAAAKQQVQDYIKWCNEDPIRCQKLKDLSDIWQKATDPE